MNAFFRCVAVQEGERGRGPVCRKTLPRRQARPAAAAQTRDEEDKRYKQTGETGLSGK